MSIMIWLAISIEALRFDWMNALQGINDLFSWHEESKASDAIEHRSAM